MLGSNIHVFRQTRSTTTFSAVPTVTMKRFRFLAVSNVLLLCNIEYDTARGKVVQAGTIRGPVAVTVFSFFTFYYMAYMYHYATASFVEMFALLGNVAVTYVTVLIVALDQTIRRKRMLGLGNLMLDYVKYRNGFFEEMSIFDLGKHLIRVQIFAVVGLGISLNLVQFVRNLPQFYFFRSVVIFILSMSDVYILGNMIFIQFFTHFVCNEMKQLTLHHRSLPIQPLMHSFDRLIVIKRSLGATLAVRFLWTLLQLIVNVSFISYLSLLYVVDRQLTYGHAFDLTHSLVTMLINNTLVLFGVTYGFDRVQSEVCTYLTLYKQ